MTFPYPTTIIGCHLRRWRERAGLTQAQVANQIGVLQTTISFWEIGRHGIPTAQLATLAKMYGVSEAELGAALLSVTPQQAAA
ncbi:MAG: XRE family transcriptional regulator [Rhodobacteraceae bacterium]|jgi:transcriptional regulator with XRE-family HTH domain|nr:XRE family transcriptional regulator [Paracoccaceae bacterium]